MPLVVGDVVLFGIPDGFNALSQWHSTWSDKSIRLKELLPAMLACVIWGPAWAHKQVQVLCDNAAVINTRTSKCPHIMHLVRCLHFFIAHFDFILKAMHIPGVLNVGADAMSRNRPQVFVQATPTAQPHPDQVPHALWDLLVVTQPDWTSVNWRQLLSAYVMQA